MMSKAQWLGVSALFSLLAILVAMGAYPLYHEYQLTHFNCDSMLLVHKDDAQLAMAFSFNIQGNRGIALLKGTLKQGDKVSYISRKNYFSFRQKQGVFHLNSVSTVTSPADNTDTEELARFLPRFYLQQGLKFDFGIYRAGQEGYVFSTGYVPSLYCARLG